MVRQLSMDSVRDKARGDRSRGLRRPLQFRRFQARHTELPRSLLDLVRANQVEVRSFEFFHQKKSEKTSLENPETVPSLRVQSRRDRFREISTLSIQRLVLQLPSFYRSLHRPSRTSSSSPPHLNRGSLESVGNKRRVLLDAIFVASYRLSPLSSLRSPQSQTYHSATPPNRPTHHLEKTPDTVEEKYNARE